MQKRDLAAVSLRRFKDTWGCHSGGLSCSLPVCQEGSAPSPHNNVSHQVMHAVSRALFLGPANVWGQGDGGESPSRLSYSFLLQPWHKSPLLKPLLPPPPKPNAKCMCASLFTMMDTCLHRCICQVLPVSCLRKSSLSHSRK